MKFENLFSIIALNQLIKIILTLTFVIAFQNLKAQQFNFRNYSVKEGIAQSQVYSIIQDSRGYLWMGTRGGGITQFDGLKFKTYTQKDGLSSNYIFCIKESQNGWLWIGSNNGLSHFNGKKFTNYSITGTDTAQFWVLDIDFDPNGQIWLSTNIGIYRFKDGKFENISDKLGIKRTMINTLFVDEKSSVWFGTSGGLWVIDQDDEKLKLKRFTRNKGYIQSSVNSIAKDKLGRIWIGTYNDGLYVFDSDSIKRPINDPFIARQSIFDIFIDYQGFAWLATLNSGVLKMNIYNQSYSVLSENEGLSNNHVRSIAIDQSGNFWFGTSGGGVCNYFGNNFTTYDKSSGLAGNFIYSIYRDSRNRLFIGNSDKGISIFDSGRFTNHHSGNGFLNVKVKAIAEDKFGRIYLGTEANGVFIYDGVQFKALEVLNKKYVKSMVADIKGNILVATSGTGIYKINCQFDDSSIQQLTINEGLLSNRIACLHEDKIGRIWYGTENHGVSFLENFKASKIKFTAAQGLPSNSIRCFSESTTGKLRIGTAGDGIISLELYDGKYQIKNWDHRDGLSSANIYLLTTDKNGNVFSGTENGLDKISVDKNDNIVNVKHFGKGEGFTGIETCQNAVLNDMDGSIWFGTINGLTHFKPNLKLSNTSEPKTNITNVRLFYEPLANSKYSYFAGDWNIIKNIILPYNQNHLTFDFQGINFNNPEAVLYKWKLEGFDRDWSPVSRQNTVTYSNLPDGEYLFKVLACNEDGVWNQQSSTVKISITPPFWKLWWVITLFCVLVSSIIILLFRWRIQRIRKNARKEQEQLKTDKMILELEQKALRLQMNPHFIFNALNSIQSQIGNNDEQAARYNLAKFSRLMRQILDNSKHSLISLKEEINTLENYLLVEKFSNGDKFDYKIDISGETEIDFIEVPPMILQPFIENSIKHGLKNIEHRRGFIHVSIIEKEGFLECSVEDNGVGRIKSGELNKKSKETYHESTAMSVTAERLEILRENRNYQALEIIDLRDENGQAEGTKVIVRIPLK